MCKRLNFASDTMEPTKKKRTNPQDVIKLNVPLLLRLLEYAKEDAKTDMDLHVVIENLLKNSTAGKTLDMSYYDSLVPKQDDTQVNEAVEMVPSEHNEVKTFVLRKGDRYFGAIKVTKPNGNDSRSEIMDFRTEPKENPLMVLNLAIRTVFKQFPYVKEILVNVPESKKELWLKMSPTQINGNKYAFYRGA